MLTKGQSIANMDKYNNSMLGNTATELAICRIEKINPDMTVEVTVMSGLSGTKVISRVRLTSPYKKDGDGIIAMPEVGALAIVAIISDVYQFILSYINHSDNSIEELRNLKEGEYLLKSKHGSYIRFNNNQSIDIHSGNNSAIFVDNDSIAEASETKSSINIASESSSGIIDNVVQGIEKWYDKDIESELTNEDLVKNASSLGEPYIELKERTPIVQIQKSNVVDEYGNHIKLNIHESPSDNPEACYKFEVMNNKESKLKLFIGKDGSIELEGNVFKLKCNNFDLTQSKNISYSALNFIER